MIEAYVKELIQGERKGLFSHIIKALLFCLSIGFKIIVTVRNKIYDRGFLQKKVSLPVTSVGNIVAGGAGKTPFVIYFANEILQTEKVGILLRGYRSESEKKSTPILVQRDSDPKIVGDEALLLAKRLPKSLVIVCKDRRKGAELALHMGATHLLLDDGLQHRKIYRDQEIIVVDALDPFGKGFFLPRGFLRDDPKVLKRADLIVLTNCFEENSSLCATNKIKEYSAAPILCTKPVVRGVCDLQGRKITSSFSHKKVGIFSAIANPCRFKTTVESMGALIVHELKAMDHKTFSSKSLSQFAEEAKKKGAEFLLCTEKDRVKINESITLPITIGWVKIELEKLN